MIDHSVQVDAFGTRDAFTVNAEREFERNRERYAFLRWGQGAFEHSAVVPPDTGIVHQVNIEYLARVVFGDEAGGGQAYPDTLVGHGLAHDDGERPGGARLGSGRHRGGGGDARPADVDADPAGARFQAARRAAAGATATDLVLTVTEMLRERGVVGMFVEFYGDGLAGLPIADRATIGNMSPEFGSTCAIFPVDAETLRYLSLTGRPDHRIEPSRLTPASRRCGTTSTPPSRSSPITSARPRLGGAQSRRPQASPGPGGAERRAGGVRRGVEQLHLQRGPGRTEKSSSTPRMRRSTSPTGLRPSRQRLSRAPPGARRRGAQCPPAHTQPAGRTAARAHASAQVQLDGESSSSTTATW